MLGRWLSTLGRAAAAVTAPARLPATHAPHPPAALPQPQCLGLMLLAGGRAQWLAPTATVGSPCGSSGKLTFVSPSAFHHFDMLNSAPEPSPSGAATPVGSELSFGSVLPPSRASIPKLTLKSLSHNQVCFAALLHLEMHRTSLLLYFLLSCHPMYGPAMLMEITAMCHGFTLCLLA